MSEISNTTISKQMSNRPLSYRALNKIRTEIATHSVNPITPQDYDAMFMFLAISSSYFVI